MHLLTSHYILKSPKSIIHLSTARVSRLSSSLTPPLFFLFSHPIHKTINQHPQAQKAHNAPSTASSHASHSLALEKLVSVLALSVPQFLTTLAGEPLCTSTPSLSVTVVVAPICPNPLMITSPKAPPDAVDSSAATTRRRLLNVSLSVLLPTTSSSVPKLMTVPSIGMSLAPGVRVVP